MYLVLGGSTHKTPKCASREIFCKAGESWTPWLLEWASGFPGKQIQCSDSSWKQYWHFYLRELIPCAKKDPDIPACLPSRAVISQWLLIFQKREAFRQFLLSLKTHLTNSFVLIKFLFFISSSFLFLNFSYCNSFGCCEALVYLFLYHHLYSGGNHLQWWCFPSVFASKFSSLCFSLRPFPALLLCMKSNSMNPA